MQPKKCSLELYVAFLLASQRQFSAVELSKVSPTDMAHDAVTRWLSDTDLSPKELWKHASALVKRRTGYLILDDSVLDKPYSKQIPFVKAQWSGKHHEVVLGICIVTLLWTDGERIIPVDFRVYDPSRDGKSKNEHARDMLDTAENRGFKPEYVLFDSWYSSIENLKSIRKKEWNWIAELKSNRQVSLVQGAYRDIKDLDWTSTQVQRVWLKEYGFVQAAEIDRENGDIVYLATNDLTLVDALLIKEHSDCRWNIETFHRGIKQFCGIEHCYSQRERSQLNHILCAFLAFLKLELRRIRTGVSWFEQKLSITRGAITVYLANA